MVLALSSGPEFSSKSESDSASSSRYEPGSLRILSPSLTVVPWRRRGRGLLTPRGYFSPSLNGEPRAGICFLISSVDGGVAGYSSFRGSFESRSPGAWVIRFHRVRSCSRPPGGSCRFAPFHPVARLVSSVRPLARAPREFENTASSCPNPRTTRSPPVSPLRDRFSLPACCTTTLRPGLPSRVISEGYPQPADITRKRGPGLGPSSLAGDSFRSRPLPLSRGFLE